MTACLVIPAGDYQVRGLPHLYLCPPGMTCRNGQAKTESNFWPYFVSEASGVRASRCESGRCLAGSHVGAEPRYNVIRCTERFDRSSLLCGSCKPGYNLWGTHCVECRSNFHIGSFLLLFIYASLGAGVYHSLSTAMRSEEGSALAKTLLLYVSAVLPTLDVLASSDSTAFNVVELLGLVSTRSLPSCPFRIPRDVLPLWSLLLISFVFAGMAVVVLAVKLFDRARRKWGGKPESQRPLALVNSAHGSEDESLDEPFLHLRSQSAPEPEQEPQRFAPTWVALLLWAYGQVVSGFVKLLQCPDSPAGHVVRAFPHLSCDAGLVHGFVALYSILLATSFLGLAVTVMWWGDLSSLPKPMHSVREHLSHTLRGARPLYELVFLVRQVVIGVASALFSTQPHVLLNVVSLVAAVNCFIQVTTRPWKDAATHNAEIVCNVSLFLLAFLMQFGANAHTVSLTVGELVPLIACALAPFLFVAGGYVRRKCTKRQSNRQSNP